MVLAGEVQEEASSSYSCRLARGLAHSNGFKMELIPEVASFRGVLLLQSDF